MTRYTEDKERLIQLENTIKTKQELLDKIIAKEVYNLTDEEIGIIKQYINIW